MDTCVRFVAFDSVIKYKKFAMKKDFYVRNM